MSPESTTHGGVVSVEITEENETRRGWVYEAQVSWKSQGVSTHTITLSWVDHDALSGGAESPSAVVRRVVEQAATGLGRGGIPEKADVSTLLRLVSRG